MWEVGKAKRQIFIIYNGMSEVIFTVEKSRSSNGNMLLGI